jgi:hypothetical protein
VDARLARRSQLPFARIIPAPSFEKSIAHQLFLVVFFALLVPDVEGCPSATNRRRESVMVILLQLIVENVDPVG